MLFRSVQVQKRFAPVYGLDDAALLENVFDTYFQDDEEFKLGTLSCRVVHLPGHTPDHIGYIFGKAVFTGDSIFNVSPLLSPDIIKLWKSNTPAARCWFRQGRFSRR